jgi:inositol-phosphate phosphatase/L-galactose 1-phosphate phosphatase/histidinol-phosphatase
MTAPCPEPFIAFAEELAEAAGAVVRPYFRRPLAVADKADQSPVTAADREAEAAMRELIERRYPEHGIIGEELPPLRPGAEYVWLLDPIDGTKSFITGKPLFGTLVALARRGAPLLGVIDHVMLGERWVGAAGRGATLNGRPARVRPCPELALAALYASSPDMFQGAEADAFARLSSRVKLPLFGGDCYAYGLLASGHVDLVVEATLGADDYFALAAVVAAAGGVMSDWTGAPLGLASDGRVIAAGDPRVHAQALAVLRG